MKSTKLFFLGATAILASCASPQKEAAAMALEYPETKKGEVVHEYFGIEVADPYNWLENDTSSETEAWVTAQNEVTQGYLKQIGYRQQLADRMTELINYPRVGAPNKVGDYVFISKNDGLQDQSVIYYRKGDEEEKVFMDPNAMSENGTVSISLLGANDDHTLMAYSLSEAGSDWSSIHVRDIEKNEDVEDVLEWCKFSGASWYENGFFYSRYPAPQEGTELSASSDFHMVYYHEIGTPQSEDKLIYKNEDNPRLYHFGNLTEDKEYFVLYEAQGTEGVNVWFQEPNRLDEGFVPMTNDFASKSDVVDFKNGKFIVATDLDAPMRRIVAVDPANPSPENWETIVPEREVYLSSVSTGGGQMFVSYLENAMSKIYRMNYDGTEANEIELPGAGSAGGFGGEKDWETLYYSYTSFTDPGSIYAYDVATGASEVYYQADLAFNPEEYESKQVFYKSKDGTEVSMFIVHKKGLELDGTNPTLLYGYGGFNISLTPSFSTSRLLLLENGGVFAMPNLRGGGEYGEDWHNAGMLMKKQNVFDDFISAGEYLIEAGYTSSDHLAIMGGSNGGLLVGASMTQRPELFAAAIPAVGVLDMLRYHKFTVGWGWVPEYGSSEESAEMFQYLYGYSPLHNVTAGTEYPATMITTGDHDDRVVPAHSFKFAAELQAAQTGSNPTLIRIETDAGHGAGKPISKVIEEYSDMYSFVLWNTGVKEL